MWNPRSNARGILLVFLSLDPRMDFFLLVKHVPMLPIGSPITPEMKSENVGIIGEGVKVVNEEPNSPRVVASGD